MVTSKQRLSSVAITVYGSCLHSRIKVGTGLSKKFIAGLCPECLERKKEQLCQRCGNKGDHYRTGMGAECFSFYDCPEG